MAEVWSEPDCLAYDPFAGDDYGNDFVDFGAKIVNGRGEYECHLCQGHIERAIGTASIAAYWMASGYTPASAVFAARPWQSRVRTMARRSPPANPLDGLLPRIVTMGANRIGMSGSMPVPARLRDFDDLKIWAKRDIVLKEQDFRCLKCDLKDWLDEPITLELDHIDGNSKNNVRENLRCLCPNCHSQTLTWHGRNKNPDHYQGTNKVTEKQFVAALKLSKNIYRALVSLDLAPKGGNYNRARRLVKKYDIELVKIQGLTCSWSKFTPEQIKEIRLRNYQGESLASIARFFEADRTTVRNIIRRNTYKDVE